MLLRFIVLAAIATLAVGCGDDGGTKAPSGFSMPSNCKVVGSPESGPEGLQSWVLRCEDSEHIFMPDEASPVLTKALEGGGWSLCGAATGTSYYRKGDRITTLAFAPNDRRDPNFGKVYLGQKPRTVECP